MTDTREEVFDCLLKYLLLVQHLPKYGTNEYRKSSIIPLKRKWGRGEWGLVVVGKITIDIISQCNSINDDGKNIQNLNTLSTNGKAQFIIFPVTERLTNW